MLKKTKVRIVSLLSLVTGVMIFPRPSAAWNAMPAPDAASRTSVQRFTAPATISTRNVRSTLNQQQREAFDRQFQGRSEITTRELINFIISQSQPR